MFEGDNYVTISLVLPARSKVQQDLQPDAYVIFPWRTDLRPKSVKVKDLALYPAVKAMTDDMEARWSEVPKAVMDFLLCCCVLDPRFRTLAWPGASPEMRVQGLQAFKSAFQLQWSITPEEKAHQAAQEKQASESAAESVVESEEEEQPRKKMKSAEEKALRLTDARYQTVSAVDFFASSQPAAVPYITAIAHSTQDGPVYKKTADEEIQEYLSLPVLNMATNALEWWKAHHHQYPRLARMARQYLATPATSACVERFFSAAGLAFDDLRQAMAEGNLEDLMWAKFNYVNIRKQTKIN